MQIKQKQVYVTADGIEFNNPAAATAHETQVAEVSPLLVLLDASDNIPADRYVQHDVAVIRGVKRELFKVVLRYYGDSFPSWRDADPDAVHPLSGVGRVLDDGSGPLADAWRLLCRFDFDNGREYQQTYFVAHPSGTTELRQHED